MRAFALGLGLALLCASGQAVGAPGVGDPVYGAWVQKGVTEFEARYGRLMGGAARREDGLVLEVEHAFTSRLSLAGLVETGRQPDRSRTVDALAIEAIYTTGRIDALGLDTAVYAEFKHGLRGEPDALELKGLFQHQAGKFDSRLNLIAEKPLQAGEPVELGYAASVGWAVIGDELRFGLAAFGDLGTTKRFGGRQEHYLGPETKFEVEHVGPGEIEVELGYLRAFGAARDRTDGQARVLIGYEVHF